MFEVISAPLRVNVLRSEARFSAEALWLQDSAGSAGSDLRMLLLLLVDSPPLEGLPGLFASLISSRRCKAASGDSFPL